MTLTLRVQNNFYTVRFRDGGHLLPGGGGFFSECYSHDSTVFCYLHLIRAIVLITQPIAVIFVISWGFVLDSSIGFISQQIVFTEPFED
jgi:hypothetical protein